MFQSIGKSGSRLLTSNSSSYEPLPSDSRNPLDISIDLRERNEHKEHEANSAHSKHNAYDPPFLSIAGIQHNSGTLRRATSLRTSRAVASLVIFGMAAYFFALILPNHSGHNEAQDVNIRKAIVMASYSKQDISWTKTMPQGWEIFRYQSDDPLAGHAASNPEGREGNAYLSYVVDHYDDLADIVVFHHGDNRAWHQPAPTSWLLQALDVDQVREHGYVNLRCSQSPGCQSWSWGANTTRDPGFDAWLPDVANELVKRTFQPEDTWYERRPDPAARATRFTHLPESLNSPCCAQFAVSKERIRSYPVEYWKRVREPLERRLPEIQDILNGEHVWDKPYFWIVSSLYEPLWQIWFGLDSSTCVEEEQCFRSFFGNRIRCSRPTTDWVDGQSYADIYCEYSEGGLWPDPGGFGDTLMDYRQVSSSSKPEYEAA